MQAVYLLIFHKCSVNNISLQVIGNAVRQLQHLVSDESCVECYDLFISESKSNGTGGMCSSAAERQIPELIYQKKAEKLLSDENCMKIVLVNFNLSLKISYDFFLFYKL